MTEHVQNFYKVTPREARDYITQIISVGLVPYLQSSPGMGKSSIVRSISNEYKLSMIDHRLSTSSPVDLSGMPFFENGRASFMPFDLFPVEGTPVPEDKVGWMLFLDEFNSATKNVQAAAYKLILDKMVGQHHLAENCAIVCAGNLATDRAITNPLSTAMQSRVIHLEMELHFQQWMEDVAFAEQYDSRVIAYLSYQPSKIMDFRPEHNEKTFCCPRTWEFVNKLVKGKEINAKTGKLLAGAITSGVAADFVNFVQVYQNMPSLNAILADPEGMFIPTDQATKWAVVTHLIEKAEDSNLEKITEYVDRFPMEFRTVFYRYLLVKKPAYRSNPHFIRAMVAINRHLNNPVS